MERQQKRWSIERLVVVGAIGLGLAAGTYGIASAANGSGSSQSSAASSGGWQPIAARPSSNAPNAQRPWAAGAATRRC